MTRKLPGDTNAAWALLSLITLVLLLSANTFAYSVLHIGVRQGDWFPLWTLTREYMVGYWEWTVGKVLLMALLLNIGVTIISWLLWTRSEPSR